MARAKEKSEVEVKSNPMEGTQTDPLMATMLGSIASVLERIGQPVVDLMDVAAEKIGLKGKEEHYVVENRPSAPVIDDTIKPGAASRVVVEPTRDLVAELKTNARFNEQVNAIYDNPIRLQEEDRGPTTAAIAFNLPPVQASLPMGRGAAAPAAGASMPGSTA